MIEQDNLVTITNIYNELSKRKNRAPERVTLTEKQENALKAKLHNDIQLWKESRGRLEYEVARYNDITEGIMPAKDFPWENSANFHIPVTLIHIKGAHTVITQTILEAEPIIRARSIFNKPNSEEFAKQLERFIQNKMMMEEGNKKKIADVIWLAFQDGTCVTQDYWNIEKYKQKDVQKYKTVEDFVADFPNAKKAGLSDEQYGGILDDISNGQEVEIETERTVVKEYPKLDIVPLGHLIVLPFTVNNEDDAIGVGKRWWQNKNQIKEKASYDLYDSKVADGLVSEQKQISIIDRAKLDAENLNYVNELERDSFETYEILYDFDLDGDGIDEKILVTYLFNQSKFLRVEVFNRYGHQSPFIFWRTFSRPNRLLGRGFAYILDDINLEVDTLHNQRIDSISIKNVPTFKAQAPLTINGMPIDPNDYRLKFRPGAIFVLDAPDKLNQLQVSDVDFTSSFRDEQNLMHLAELLTGVTQGLTGSAASFDPRAPASKYLAQLNQARSVLDGYITEISYSLIKCVKNYLILTYQHGQDQIEYYFSDPDTSQLVKSEIDRVKLNPDNIFIQIAKQSVMNNPEFEAQKAIMLFQLFMPILQQFPDKLRELMKAIVVAMKWKDVDLVVPSLQDFKGVQQQQQQMAQQQQQVGNQRKNQSASQQIPQPPGGVAMGGM